MLRVEDELEGELGFPQNMENPEGGRPRKFYTLTLKQATLVAMRESKAVRREAFLSEDGQAALHLFTQEFGKSCFFGLHYTHRSKNAATRQG